jgi:hypothetical protein
MEMKELNSSETSINIYRTKAQVGTLLGHRCVKLGTTFRTASERFEPCVLAVESLIKSNSNFVIKLTSLVMQCTSLVLNI